MQSKTRTNFFISSLISIVVTVLSQTESDVLQDIFSSTLASHFTNLHSIGTSLDPDWALASDVSQNCLSPANNFSDLSDCLKSQQKFISLRDVETLYKITSNQSLSKQDVQVVSPALIYSMLVHREASKLNQAAQNDTDQKHSDDEKPSSESSWGYSFLFVTLINLCSLTGAVVLPCMKLKSYKLVLMFMVALAVGTLVGSGLLFLIPEAFALVHGDDIGYIWKSTTIMGGIYLFYITEKVMRMINKRRENTSLKKRRDELATEGAITTSFRRIPIDNSLPEKDPKTLPEGTGGICSPIHMSNSSSHSNFSNDESTSPNSGDNDRDNGNGIEINMDHNGGRQTLLLYDASSPPQKPVQNGHGHSHHLAMSEGIAPVAYMIIFGDALHNFIDGLSIGSAFTQNTMTGVSVSVAVMCEELPHELGDFAILLNSGMKFKRAIMYNFLSACTCYVGTAVGILLGENTQSHEWIFAIAGGMFLYISLVDMMPEMNTAAESPEGRQFGEMKTFLLQNFGLLCGFAIMLIMALYGGNIEF